MKIPRIFKKTTALASLVSIAFAPTLVLACAVAIQSSPNGKGWDYAMPTNAQGFISYENGIEKMVMSHDIEAEANKGIAIITPIPADPTKVKLDVLTSLPQLSGEDITVAAQEKLLPVASTLSYTQVWTMAPLLLDLYREATRGDTVNSSDSFSVGSTASGYDYAASPRRSEPDVKVFDSLNKEGITSEVITAKTSSGLYDYLKGKGLNTEPGSISVLNTYIGKDYSFVVSWVTGDSIAPSDGSNHTLNSIIPFDAYTDSYVQNKNQKGIFVSFPTDKIYSPLIPISAYSSGVHPETIRVIGHVSPDIYKDIKPYTTVSYHQDDTPYFPGDSSKFFSNDSSKPVKYTDISISAPAKSYTKDLLISTHTPLKVYSASIISNYPWVYGIILLIISSLLASILAGFFIFKEDKVKWSISKFIILGLSNLLTFIGLIILSSRMLPKKEVPAEDQELFQQLKEKGYSTGAVFLKDHRRRWYLLLFTVLFLIIVWGLTYLSGLSLFI